MNNELKTVHLYGKLAEICGTDKVELVGESIQILISGLDSRFKVKPFILENDFEVVYDHQYADPDTLDMNLSRVTDVHLYPVVEGSGNRATQIIVGAALIVAGFYTGGQTWMVLGQNIAGTIGTALVTTGVGLVLSGIFRQSYSANDRERPDDRQSFLFNGAVNVLSEGSVVPLVYGRTITGSVVLSTGLDIGQMQNPISPVGPPPGQNPPPGFGPIDNVIVN